MSLGVVDGAASLFIGTRQHSLFALDACTGDRRWRAPANYSIDATPTWFSNTELSAVVAGSYDGASTPGGPGSARNYGRCPPAMSPIPPLRSRP